MNYTVSLRLSADEKKNLRSHHVKIGDLPGFAPDERAALLGADGPRAQEVNALIEFQQVPSLGPGFAAELISQGYYSLEQLRGKDAVSLLHAYELHMGAWADPCVEDSYRLLEHYIEHRDLSKRWWHFTAERKAYRAQHGYPPDRPKTPWYTLEHYTKP